VQIERIGIDFGTSNTAASVRGMRDGQPLHEILALDQGPLLKSLLYFPNGRDSFFGKAAIEQYFENDREGRFFQSIKRLLPNPDFKGTQIANRFVSLESLIARLLENVRNRIETQLGTDITELPVTFGRPALYSLDADREKLATSRFLEAIRLAGFKNPTLLEEPTAAARSVHAASTAHLTSGIRLVADLGGGTSDFTLLRTRGDSSPPEVLAVHGIPLAGDALDSAFVEARLLRHFGSEVRYQRPFSSNILTFPTSLISRIPKWHQHVILKEKSNWNFLLDLRKELVNPGDRGALENIITLIEENLGYQMHKAVEDLKIRLSSRTTPEPEEFSFRSHPIDLLFPVSRPDYGTVVQPVVERIRSTAEKAIALAGLKPGQVDILSFTGGTAQVPELRHAIASLVPTARLEDQDSFTAVALGLSV